ncbi:MAG: hypothetical protein JSU70_02440 [Phycisphaerales bacterium]|nr:MAG: hypothetical protein JSU70_02440 [Phycisphaerales bacterium]
MISYLEQLVKQKEKKEAAVSDTRYFKSGMYNRLSQCPTSAEPADQARGVTDPTNLAVGLNVVGETDIAAHEIVAGQEQRNWRR